MIIRFLPLLISINRFLAALRNDKLRRGKNTVWGAQTYFFPTQSFYTHPVELIAQKKYGEA